MKLISRIFILPAACLVSLSAAAQSDPVGDFAAQVAESRITFDYSYVMKNPKLSIQGNGGVIAQDDCYYLEGNGLKVWSDGRSVWTMDEDAGEVVIEPAESANGLSVNPVILVMNVDRIFTWDEGRPSNFGGKSCKVYSLIPVVKTGFKDVKFYMSGSNLIGVALETEGASLTFTISNLNFQDYGDVSTFNPGTFSSDCIVTDLR